MSVSRDAHDIDNQALASLLTGMWMLLQPAIGKQHVQAIHPCTLFEVLHVVYKQIANCGLGSGASETVCCTRDSSSQQCCTMRMTPQCLQCLHALLPQDDHLVMQQKQHTSVN